MTSVGSRKKGCPALGLVLWLAVSAGAHIGDRVYPVGYLSDEMLEKIDLRDGLVDEWYEVVGEPSMTMLDFTSLDRGISPDPSDLDFRIWLAWHDDPAASTWPSWPATTFTRTITITMPSLGDWK